MTSSKFKPMTQRSSRLFAMLGFLGVLLAFVAVTFFLLTRDSRVEREWIRLSSDLQVHSQRLAKSAAEAVDGSQAAFGQMADWAAAMSATMSALKEGNAVRGLPALPGSTSPTLADLGEFWSRMDANTRSILDRETTVLDLASASNSFIEAIPGIQDLTDRATRELTRNGASAQQVFIAGRQLVLSDRMLRHMKEMLRGGTESMAAADSLKQETEYFEQTMNALLRGSSRLGVEQVTIPQFHPRHQRPTVVFVLSFSPADAQQGLVGERPLEPHPV